MSENSQPQPQKPPAEENQDADRTSEPGAGKKGGAAPGQGDQSKSPKNAKGSASDGDD